MNAIVVNCNDNIVQVKSHIGCFEGIFCSDKAAEYRQYDFELASDDIITQKSLRFSTISLPSVDNYEDAIIINGLVEAVEDDILFLRLSGDVLMLNHSPDSNFAQYVGRYVQIRLSEIKLYDTGIY